MKAIEKLDFTKLWHSEYPFVYSKMVEIVEKHNPKELRLNKALERVKAHVSTLRKIEIQESSSIYSKRLEEIDNQRDNITRAIYKMTKSWLMADLDATRQEADTVMQALKKHHVRYLDDEEYAAQTNHTKALLQEADKNKELTEALKLIHIAPLFSELKKVNAQFEKIFLQRTYEQAELEKIDCKAIRRAADKEMKRLLALIDLYQEEYPSLDYQKLIAELNELLHYHKSIVKNRTLKFIEENSEHFNVEDSFSMPMN